MGGNMKVYIMPDGRKYQFADDQVPEGAVLASKKKAEKKPEKKPEKKIEEKKAAPKNKAKKPANKSKKAATK